MATLDPIGNLYAQPVPHQHPATDITGLEATSGEGAEKITPQGLWAFRRGLSWNNLAAAHIVCVGSSTTNGWNASSTENTWLNLMGRRLQARLAPHVGVGTHLLSGGFRNSGWTFSGATREIHRGLSLWSRRLDPGASMWRTVDDTTGFIVYYDSGPNEGGFDCVVDNGAPFRVTPATNGFVRSDGIWNLGSNWARGRHTIRINAIGGCTINGVYALDGNHSSGLRVYNAGRGGTSSRDYVDPYNETVASHWAQMGRLDPSLVILMIGANDVMIGVPPDEYENNVERMVRYARGTNNPPPSVLLVHTYGRFDAVNPTYPWAAYRDAQQRVAERMPDTDFVDIETHFPATQLADADADMMDTDNVHMTNRGHSWMAELIADHLRGRIAEPSAPPSPATAVPVYPDSDTTNLVAGFRADTLAGGHNTTLESWSPFKGYRIAPFKQPDANMRPLLLHRAVGEKKAVRFTSSPARWMQTDPWSAGYIYPPVTMLMIVRINWGGGNLFSGRQGPYLFAGKLADGILQIGAGELANNTFLYHTAYRFIALGIVYDGTQSRSQTYGLPMNTFTTNTGHPNAHLTGMTWNSNSSGTLSYADSDLAELMVFSRAFSPVELDGALAAMSRYYAIDSAGRTTPTS